MARLFDADVKISFAALVLSAGLVGAAPAQAAGAIRMSWQHFAQDPLRLAAFRKAVATMKALNAADHSSVDYRKSWEYWANIHGYFGPDSPDGTVAQNEEGVSPQDMHFFNGVNDISAPDQVARDVWANCQHGTPWFFSWHRLYLLYFEKQLQAAAGDPNLRLPYWDYTNPAQTAMPAEFTQATYKDASGAQQPNPLFEPRRAPGWSKGGEKLNANSTNIDSWLKQKDFSRYQDGIENNVHGYVHCSVATNCPVVDMGAVPYSSNDPIFWVHHANIDRLWSCWTNIPGRKNLTDASYLNQSFSFVDPLGQEVQNTVGDLFKGSLIDYKYEQETNCGRSGPAIAAATVEAASATTTAVSDAKVESMVQQGPSISKPTGPVQLKATTTSVNVELQRQGDLASVSELALGVHPATPTRTELVLEGITFAAPPGAQFYVYLADASAPDKREYAGTVNFFAVSPAGMHVGHHHAGGSGGGEGVTRDFDVTDALRKLGVDKPDLSSVTVSFEATNGREGSTETPEINDKSALTVNSVAFRVVPAE